MTHDDPLMFCSAMQCVRWPCCRPLAVVTRRCSAAVACGQIGGETCFTRKLEIKYSANTGECGHRANMVTALVSRLSVVDIQLNWAHFTLVII